MEGDVEGGEDDVAVFTISDEAKGNLATLPLSDVCPQPGESVWLVAQVLAGSSQSQHLHHAIVWAEIEGELNYTFDDPLDLTATSGAAVVNHKGEVVAIHLGSFEDEDGVNGVGKLISTVSPFLPKP